MCVCAICILKAAVYSSYSLYVACLTERARIEAQIKTAEAAARTRAEEESRHRREKEREAARVAIEKVLLINYKRGCKLNFRYYVIEYLMMCFVDAKNR